MTNHKFLLIKKKSNLKDYEKLLYDAYSSKVRNILLIASKLLKKEFDPVKMLFWGLESISKEESYKKRYRAILEITEYFQNPTQQHLHLISLLYVLIQVI